MTFWKTSVSFGRVDGRKQIFENDDVIGSDGLRWIRKNDFNFHLAFFKNRQAYRKFKSGSLILDSFRTRPNQSGLWVSLTAGLANRSINNSSGPRTRRFWVRSYLTCNSTWRDNFVDQRLYGYRGERRIVSKCWMLSISFVWKIRTLNRLNS